MRKLLHKFARGEIKMDGYCLKCKQSRTMKDLKYVKTANGRTMAKGVCPVCSTTINKFLSKAEAEKVAHHTEPHKAKEVKAK
jgi:Domain of unknown function (DUF5679)